MVSWGIVSLLFTWVANVEQLYILRFILGVAEAGFFPGAILFLSLWVPARHRSKILALFYLAQPLTTVIGAPLAGILIQQHGLFGLEGWRVMFLGVAIPPSSSASSPGSTWRTHLPRPSGLRPKRRRG